MASEVQVGSDLSHIQLTFPFDSNDMGMFFALATILTFSLEMLDLFQGHAVEEGVPGKGIQDSSMTSDPWFEGMIVDGHIVSPGAFALNIQSNNEGFESNSVVPNAQDTTSYGPFRSLQEHGDPIPEPVQNPASRFQAIRPFNPEAGNTLSSAKAKKRYRISIYC
jgi:hypothetical protein